MSAFKAFWSLNLLGLLSDQNWAGWVKSAGRGRADDAGGIFSYTNDVFRGGDIRPWSHLGVFGYVQTVGNECKSGNFLEAAARNVPSWYEVGPAPTSDYRVPPPVIPTLLIALHGVEKYVLGLLSRTYDHHPSHRPPWRQQNILVWSWTCDYPAPDPLSSLFRHRKFVTHAPISNHK